MNPTCREGRKPPMEQFEMLVPTYYGMMHAKMHPHEDKEDFGEPIVPVLVRHAEGVRVVLGTHDFEDMDKPDIQIERRPNGWAIFLHPIGGGDSSGLVYFLDDGRSYLMPDGLASGEIRIVEFEEQVPLLDDPPAKKLLQKLVGQDSAPVRAGQERSPDLRSETAAKPAEPEPIIVANGSRKAISPLEQALRQAEDALAGDSNDAEHDALLALLEVLRRPGPSTST